ncbi:alpha/beta fold hydrolase [Novosphingobium sp. Gsoil 351]|uniref:alpha/beta fold hydrolase n=1 Tax=Novosphingobium sp. Gsoil 351 TaxID=2675225 RepID=UPI0012B4F2BA|nr:alpha/beta fold hydrolase [Novosphingobium sp. Gsoil 351]QGN56078.1 alpha/beta fold hydrolase [Novosphingobium sp. Gsoil 351]
MPVRDPIISSLRIHGRRLRVAQWNFAGQHRGLPPLLVFNGIGMNLELLDPLARAMGPRRVLCFDMPGIGKSPDPVMPYNAVSMALATAAMLDRLELERVDVLGISWGGGIAQQFALQHRARVGRLVLAATSAGMTMAPGSLPALSRLADPAEWSMGKALERNLALLYNGGGTGDPVSLNAATPPSPAGFMYQLAALAGWSSVPLLPLLDVPTLILAGDEDQVVPPVNSRFLHALIPGSTLALIRGGGHLFPFSHRKQFLEKLNAFLVAHEPVDSP